MSEASPTSPPAHADSSSPPSVQPPPPASIEHALHARIDAFSPVCPSARTSYTRVDLTSGTRANTPRPDITHDVDDEEVPEETQQAPAEELIPQTPQVSLTFLLVSGRRRTMSFEPETTIGRVKELVWNAWPNDWQDERPPAPSYLRVLYLGKILQDDDSLDSTFLALLFLKSITTVFAELSFPTQLPSASPSSTIVHLSIRAYAPPSEDVPKKKRRSTAPTSAAGEAGDEESAGCCSSCIIC
ncbi:ubiquitin-related domain-containing protein [Daedaleopsis nitida]|nr:ubiquitin-related domain-containing protein [Daedaleopsis nitida]